MTNDRGDVKIVKMMRFCILFLRLFLKLLKIIDVANGMLAEVLTERVRGHLLIELYDQIGYFS